MSHCTEDMLQPMWGFLQRLVRYDPVPALENIRCPVLAIFGAEDQTVPVGPSIDAFERGMARAGNRNLTVRTFPGADHGMRIDSAGTLASGYLELIANWVLHLPVS